MSERKLPHRKIGEFLKQKREAIHESLAEVSGAVEIDLDMLHKIETGRVMPSEDILLLLLSHLNVEEDDARRLLDIAGYSETMQSDEAALRQMFMVLPFDSRVMHTDDAEVRVKKDSVVIEFMQDSSGSQPMAISRVGMSKRQAMELVDRVQTAIIQAERPVQPKLLPAPKLQRKDVS